MWMQCILCTIAHLYEYTLYNVQCTLYTIHDLWSKPNQIFCIFYVRLFLGLVHFVQFIYIRRDCKMRCVCVILLEYMSIWCINDAGLSHCMDNLIHIICVKHIYLVAEHCIQIWPSHTLQIAYSCGHNFVVRTQMEILKYINIWQIAHVYIYKYVVLCIYMVVINTVVIVHMWPRNRWIIKLLFIIWQID